MQQIVEVQIVGSGKFEYLVGHPFLCHYSYTSLNPVPNAQVCVYLTLHITKLQLQTAFPKPLYIPHG
jgi:hypothetical protein